MAFCSNCGTKVEDGVKFCPKCGTAMQQQAQQQTAQQQQAQQQTAQPNAQQQQQYQPNQQPNQFQNTFNKFNNTKDFTSEFDKTDIEQNKVMALLSYLSILVLVPIFGAPQSKFARFHANQGVVLLIVDIILGILNAILSAIILAIFVTKSSYYGYTYSTVSGFGLFLNGLVATIIYVAIGILSILGIVNAVKGKAKQLPIIGKFKILK